MSLEVTEHFFDPHSDAVGTQCFSLSKKVGGQQPGFFFSTSLCFVQPEAESRKLTPNCKIFALPSEFKLCMLITTLQSGRNRHKQPKYKIHIRAKEAGVHPVLSPAGQRLDCNRVLRSTFTRRDEWGHTLLHKCAGIHKVSC